MVTSAHFPKPTTVPLAMDATTTAPGPADELVDLATLSTETIMGLAAGSCPPHGL